MSNGRAIARIYQDGNGPTAGMSPPSSFRQLWLVGALIVVSVVWPTSSRVAAAPAVRSMAVSSAYGPAPIRATSSARLDR